MIAYEKQLEARISVLERQLRELRRMNGMQDLEDIRDEWAHATEQAARGDTTAIRMFMQDERKRSLIGTPVLRGA